MKTNDGTKIDHSRSQPGEPTHDKLFLKGTWSCHMIHIKFQGPKHTSGIKLESPNFLHRYAISNATKRTTYHPLNGRGYAYVTV